jgi:DNA-binding NtrC family response regulator
MKQLKIFIVEDDLFFGELLRRHISLNPDYEVFLFGTGKECLGNLHHNPDVISIDFGLPDMRVDILLKKIQDVNKEVPIIVISGQEDVGVAVSFLKAGAKDYIIKDDHTKEALWNSILKLRENLELRKEVEVLKVRLEQKYSFEKTIIGQSKSLKAIFTLVDKAVRSNINITISGETGTGKEVVAKAIHYNSERKKKPFIAVNMAAIPIELVESELFGYEKGAFTGAMNRKLGRFEEANGGTLFLDEIAELDLSLQSKILRALQEREINRVGGQEPIKINVRLITATHKNLAESVKSGKFREDLYYRIIGLPIELPPLRQRGNDILILAKYFVSEFAKENKLAQLMISSAANDKLMGYHFPGNVRELKSVMELACVLSDGAEISEQDIRLNALRGNDLFSIGEKTMKEYTNDIISHYLKKYNQDVLEVAKRLDIGKSTIYSLIQKKEIERD